jgi:hypothetical protein
MKQHTDRTPPVGRLLDVATVGEGRLLRVGGELVIDRCPLCGLIETVVEHSGLWPGCHDEKGGRS